VTPIWEFDVFVTPLYASLLSLWFVVLSVRVIRERRAGSGSHYSRADCCMGSRSGFSEAFPVGRVGGTVLTISVLSTSAVLCIWQGLQGR
jgi:uncharacterized membrane protein YecN with MAPEG domain